MQLSTMIFLKSARSRFGVNLNIVPIYHDVDQSHHHANISDMLEKVPNRAEHCHDLVLNVPPESEHDDIYPMEDQRYSRLNKYARVANGITSYIG